MTGKPDRVTLVLEGHRARDGVALGAFEDFVSNFLRALLYHFRSTRAAVVRRPGRPVGDDELAMSFRLVEFRRGSGIAVLEPPVAEEGDTLVPPPSTLSWANLEDLVNQIEHQGHVNPDVTDALQAALRSLGADAWFSVEVASHGEVRRTEVKHEVIARLRSAEPPAEALASDLIVVGVLHAIDLEPDKVAIRTATGLDWSCEYPSELESDVLPLVGRRVSARGVGRTTSARGGVLELTDIRPMVEAEQTRLFTGPPVPLDELHEQQRITAPQGLAALRDPFWEDNEESERFLSALLDET